jgi:phosphatidylglycerophosphate synthase
MLQKPAVSSEIEPVGRFAVQRTALGQLIFSLLVGVAASVAVAALLVGADPRALGLTLAGYLMGVVFAVSLLRRGFPHASLGWGNQATLARMALVASLMAPILSPAVTWAFVAVAVLALTLDGLDGWLARRERLVSDFGARLDTEVDSALGLILALNVWALGVAGPLVLLIGLPRYAFVAAAVFLPWLSKPLPDSYGRKVVCVVQLVSLVVLCAQILPSWSVMPVVYGVAAALAWSFGRDIIWLWKSRP